MSVSLTIGLKTKKKQKKRGDSKLSLYWDSKKRGWSCLHSDLHFEYGSARLEAESRAESFLHTFQHTPLSPQLYAPRKWGKLHEMWWRLWQNCTQGRGEQETSPYSETRTHRPKEPSLPPLQVKVHELQHWQTQWHLKEQHWFLSHKLKTTNAFHICEKKTMLLQYARTALVYSKPVWDNQRCNLLGQQSNVGK